MTAFLYKILDGSVLQIPIENGKIYSDLMKYYAQHRPMGTGIRISASCFPGVCGLEILQKIGV